MYLYHLTPHQSKYYAWLLTRQAEGGSMDSLATTLVDAQVDLNPHQIDAALFACKNPLSKGVILADEVGLGKTIEAGLVILQHWAERKRKILIITPANLRKQWHQELQEKFGLQGTILEAKSYNVIKKAGKNPFRHENPVICSYQFAKSKADDIKQIGWDLVVLDEAHRLRNVYKKNNVIGKTLKEALENVSSKVLLTATPLQNSLLELYGLVSMIDDRVFGDLDSFRAQFGTKATEQTLFICASDSALFANVPYAAKYRLMFPTLSALPSCKNLLHPTKSENFLIWLPNTYGVQIYKQCQKDSDSLFL